MYDVPRLYDFIKDFFFLSRRVNISNRRNTHASMRKLTTTRNLRQYYYLLSYYQWIITV